MIPVFRGSVPQTGGVAWAPGAPFPDVGQVTGILALWGQARGDAAALQVNTDLAMAAQHLARELGADCVVHCSSQAVYTPLPGLLGENSAIDGPTAYGHAKRKMESAISHELSLHRDDPRTVVFRMGNVAGADSLFGNLKPGGDVTLDRFANGRGPERCYLSPHDLATALEHTLKNHAMQGCYNLSAPELTSMQDVTAAAGGTVTWVDAPEGALQRLHLDTARLTRICPELTFTSDPAELVSSARRTGIWP